MNHIYALLYILLNPSFQISVFRVGRVFRVVENEKRKEMTDYHISYLELISQMNTLYW